MCSDVHLFGSCAPQMYSTNPTLCLFRYKNIYVLDHRDELDVEPKLNMRGQTLNKSSIAQSVASLPKGVCQSPVSLS